MDLIYMDHAATTPLHPDVLEQMIPYLRDHFGNPSSLHTYGRSARLAVSDARDRLAAHLGCAPRQLLFTSGGTESDNLAVFGAAMAQSGSGLRKHIITSQIEHQAVLRSCQQLEKLGHEVTYLPVDHWGAVDVDEAAEAMRDNTCLISIMYGNNEVGTLQPIQEIGEIARQRGIAFHVDAVQALGHEEIDLSSLPVDMMSFSAHKINGPKGVGALYVSPQTAISPLLFGGSQERNKRAGTENVAGIVGFAAAAQTIAEGRAERIRETERLRQQMIATLTEELGDGSYVIHGHPSRRLAHILNVSFPGVDRETMLMNLDLEGIAASSGSACSSGSMEKSHVLMAMKLLPEMVNSSIRFSFGYGNCLKNVTICARKAATIAKRLRHN